MNESQVEDHLRDLGDGEVEHHQVGECEHQLSTTSLHSPTLPIPREQLYSHGRIALAKLLRTARLMLTHGNNVIPPRSLGDVVEPHGHHVESKAWRAKQQRSSCSERDDRAAASKLKVVGGNSRLPFCSSRSNSRRGAAALPHGC